MTTIELKVQNMSSGLAIEKIQAILREVAGVSHVAADVASGHVLVTGGSAMSAGALTLALTEAGYAAIECQHPAATPRTEHTGPSRPTLSLRRGRSSVVPGDQT